MTFRECYSVEEVAGLLGLSPETVRDRINSGEIPHVRLNHASPKGGPRKVVVTGAQLLAYLEHNSVPAVWQRPAMPKPQRVRASRRGHGTGPLGECPA